MGGGGGGGGAVEHGQKMGEVARSVFCPGLFCTFSGDM